MPDWKEVLSPMKKSDYFKNLWAKVCHEYETTSCYPPAKQIFRALELTAFDEVKVVILGQDPYHGFGQANGLSFSVSDQVPAPPSLRNMFKELANDLGIQRTRNGLEDWAKQGVLLLNASLTVRANEANSHQHLGWSEFTDFIIKEISERKQGVAFVLWGAFAQKKANLIDGSKHFILKSAHPSPLSAHRGFLGSKPYSKINAWLESQGEHPIKW